MDELIQFLYYNTDIKSIAWLSSILANACIQRFYSLRHLLFSSITSLLLLFVAADPLTNLIFKEPTPSILSACYFATALFGGSLVFILRNWLVLSKSKNQDFFKRLLGRLQQ